MRALIAVLVLAVGVACPEDAHDRCMDAGGCWVHGENRCEFGKVELLEVRRQRHAWQVAANNELRHGDVAKGLAEYEERGALQGHESKSEAMEAVLDRWHASVRVSCFSPRSPGSAKPAGVEARANLDDMALAAIRGEELLC